MDGFGSSAVAEVLLGRRVAIAFPPEAETAETLRGKSVFALFRGLPTYGLQRV